MLHDAWRVAADIIHLFQEEEGCGPIALPVTCATIFNIRMVTTPRNTQSRWPVAPRKLSVRVVAAFSFRSPSSRVYSPCISCVFLLSYLSIVTDFQVATNHPKSLAISFLKVPSGAFGTELRRPIRAAPPAAGQTLHASGELFHSGVWAGRIFCD